MRKEKKGTKAVHGSSKVNMQSKGDHGLHDREIFISLLQEQEDGPDTLNSQIHLKCQSLLK